MPLRAGGPLAGGTRVAVGQRLALYRPRYPRAGPRHRCRPVHDPVREPASNGMAEAFVKAFKATTPGSTLPDAVRVLRQLDSPSTQGAGLPLATRIPGANGGEDDGKRGRRCASTVNAGRHQMGTAGAFASEQVGDVISESVSDLLGIQHSLMPAAGRRSRALPAGPAGCAAAGRCDCRPRRAAACRSTPKRCGFALAAAAGAHIP